MSADPDRPSDDEESDGTPTCPGCGDLVAHAGEWCLVCEPREENFGRADTREQEEDDRG